MLSYGFGPPKLPGLAVVAVGTMAQHHRRWWRSCRARRLRRAQALASLLLWRV